MKRLKQLALKLVKSPVFKGFCVVLVFVIVVCLLVDMALMPVLAGRFAARGNVPNVVGLKAEAAETALKTAGFEVEWVAEGRYSSEVPEGAALGQTPTAGREAKLGRTVFLTKSRGLREVEVPDLRGKSRKQALMSIERAGLVVGDSIAGGHISIPLTAVIRTVPAGGSIARIGDTISIVYSAGARAGKVLLPNVESLPLDSAKAKLEALGFVTGKVTNDTSSSRLPGSVMAQLPRSGEFLPAGTSVDLTIVN